MTKAEEYIIRQVNHNEYLARKTDTEIMCGLADERKNYQNDCAWYLLGAFAEKANEIAKENNLEFVRCEDKISNGETFVYCKIEI